MEMVLTKSGRRKPDWMRTIDSLHARYYEGQPKPQEVCIMARKSIGPKRNDLMIQAQKAGIKNFRILNREELMKVLDPDTSKNVIQKTIEGAKTRWKAGFGKRKK